MATASPKEKDPRSYNLSMRLVMAQNEINAPKTKYNKFAKFYYRSAEDILNAAKPVCLKYGLLLTVTDSVVEILNQPYVQAFATIADCIGEEQPITVTALAKIPSDAKGMDASQICGSASTYARKYALNGLFCIDDSSEDADAYNSDQDATKKPSVNEAISAFAKCTSREDINSIYQSTSEFHSNPEYMAALQAACKKFPK